MKALAFVLNILAGGLMILLREVDRAREAPVGVLPIVLLAIAAVNVLVLVARAQKNRAIRIGTVLLNVGTVVYLVAAVARHPDEGRTMVYILAGATVVAACTGATVLQDDD